MLIGKTVSKSEPNEPQHYGERNKFAEAEIGLWIEALLDDCIPPKAFDELLRDGVLLCR